MAELWIEPSDIASRDLFYGPGGAKLVPDPKVDYRFKALDTTGSSRGYDVEDPQGRTWDVKIGREAQPEIVVSRILWAMGYHQPVMHYVPEWRMTDGPTKDPKPGRFRLAADHETLGDWSWRENPFVGTQPLRGLVVANAVLNQWDFKTSNNRIYRSEQESKGPARWFVVQDIGSALGRTSVFVGTRDDIWQFESQDLITGVKGDRVEFDYHTKHKWLLENIPPADVVWSCRLIDRLTDRQLDDALRAAAYEPDVRDRYIRKIRQKLRQGLALETKGKNRS